MYLILLPFRERKKKKNFVKVEFGIKKKIIEGFHFLAKRGSFVKNPKFMGPHII